MQRMLLARVAVTMTAHSQQKHCPVANTAFCALGSCARSARSAPTVLTLLAEGRAFAARGRTVSTLRRSESLSARSLRVCRQLQVELSTFRSSATAARICINGSISGLHGNAHRGKKREEKDSETQLSNVKQHISSLAHP